MQFGASMKQSILVLALVALATACGGSSTGVTSVPGHGAVAVQVQPNPIVATHVSGDTYEFPFDVIVRETAGRPITITGVSATVRGPGGLSLGAENWNADQIRAMGYTTAIGAHGEQRLHFAPRKSVPDDRLFGGVSADLRVDAVDDTGTATSATTNVTITRG